ncbi:collagen alpha-1(III) chain-like [Zerene cesonia]|uniref:collagen alpha-1(III) chain-like n=1 Tax=Zerene cesonia TaxID=33412 RepID=UPI0018E50C1E|nr:collagen alpha-1(III) chain-like [Zerene cesonia]
MKLFVFITIIAYCYGDKLDRTYLPPPNAGTAGGSPGALTAPGPSSQGPFGQQAFGQQPFGQIQSTGPAGQQITANIGSKSPSGPSQPSPVYGPASGRGPSSNGFGQSNSNGFVPNRPSYNQAAIDVNSGSQQNAGPSNGYIAPSNTFGQSPSSNAYNQQQSLSGLPKQGTGIPQGQGSVGFAPERAQAAADRNAEILRYTNENDGERFEYSFETSNGISAEESGVATDGVKAQGGFSYTGDDGKAYTVTYTADENGYQPQGEHLPTPHPIPEEILKSIEINAQAAAAGTQEGAYRPDEYENEDSSQGYSSGPINRPQLQSQGQGPSQQYGGPSSNGTPTSGSFGFQPQGNQQSGSQNEGFGQTIPSGQSGQFNKPNLSDALNQALNQQTNTASSNGIQNQGQINAAQNGPSYNNGPRGQSGQGASGYQYNRPQNNQYSSGSNGQGPISSSRPQFNNQPSTSGSGFPGANGRPSGSISNGFSSPSGQNSPYNSGSSAPNRGTAPSFESTGPSSPISGQNNQYQSGSNQGQNQGLNQGYNYQAPSGPSGQPRPGSSQTQNRPSSANQGQYQPGSGNGSYRPTSNQQYQKVPSNQFQSGSNQGQSQLGSTTQYQPNRPSGFNGQGSQNQPGNQGSNQAQFSGANQQYKPGQNQVSNQAIQAPYQYNRPTQGLNSSGQGAQSGFNTPASGPGAKGSEQFGGPRQPPSFNPQDGYTY